MTDSDVLGGVLSLLSYEDLVRVGNTVDAHAKQRLQAAVVGELRAVAAEALENGETDSPAPVVQVRVHTRQADTMPPYWSARNLTFRHTDGLATFCLDASHTGLEDLLTDLTCFDQPSETDVLTITLPTGHFDR
ncbi:hypothetical protein [Streptomyces qinglanensis]|uniref:hypothetical protein n=1 Tax=Streptomyces qinglanensis TaxID=943816 RepID=UPI003D765FEC